MERIVEYYESTEPNTNPNGNGKPAIMKVEIGETDVRLVVTIESGSAMNGAGSTITISDVTVPRTTYDKWKGIMLSNTKKLG